MATKQEVIGVISENNLSEEEAMIFVMRHFRGHLNPRVAEEAIYEFFVENTATFGRDSL